MELIGRIEKIEPQYDGSISYTIHFPTRLYDPETKPWRLIEQEPHEAMQFCTKLIRVSIHEADTKWRKV